VGHVDSTGTQEQFGTNEKRAYFCVILANERIYLQRRGHGCHAPMPPLVFTALDTGFVRSEVQEIDHCTSVNALSLYR